MELDFTQADTGNSITGPSGNLRPSSSSSSRRDASLVSGFGAPSINRTFQAKHATNIAEEIKIYENPLPPISTSNGESCPDLGAMKMMITSHPRFSSLLEAYADCLKIGAPPQLAAQLESRQRAARSFHSSSSNDAELTQFMEEYYNVLVMYREELKRPLEEAMDFVRRAEFQLSELSNGSLWLFSEANLEDAGSSEEMGNACGRGREPGKDREFKNLLLKKYGEQLCTLKQEMSKKKSKISKLPKEAVEKLIRWWEQHYIWPYPSESEKMALVDSTGLTQTQISNWFINQRKRHWKPPEDARSAVAAAVYMARQSSGDGRTKDWP